RALRTCAIGVAPPGLEIPDAAALGGNLRNRGFSVDPLRLDRGGTLVGDQLAGTAGSSREREEAGPFPRARTCQNQGRAIRPHDVHEVSFVEPVAAVLRVPGPRAPIVRKSTQMTAAP